MGAVIIFRGLPGSGKTTLAAHMYPGAMMASNDDYWARLGRFDPSRWGAAISACEVRVKQGVQRGRVVVVHNTNTRLSEFRGYLRLARLARVPASVIRVNSGLSDRELAARNAHGVDAATIARYRARWERFPGERVVRSV